MGRTSASSLQVTGMGRSRTAPTTSRQNFEAEPAQGALTLPLSALLSQILVAFTVELDCEFERRMAEAGYPGSILSLVVWFNLIRFVAADGITVRDLLDKSLPSEEGLRFMLGCLERWQFIHLRPDTTDHRPVPRALHRRAHRVLREGWGSGRGIRTEWIVRLTTKGTKASEIWPPLPELVEQRWEQRFTSGEFSSLRLALQAVVSQLKVELPRGLPPDLRRPKLLPRRETGTPNCLSFAALLSHSLLSFTMEFNRESRAPLGMSASTLRVLGERARPVQDIPLLTGSSEETGGMGWQHKPFVVVESGAPGTRGKFARLTQLGLQAQQNYHRLTGDIEDRWKDIYGKDKIAALREALERLRDASDARGPLLAQGLIPPPGTVRSGLQAPALGRREVAPAARKRMREMVCQTKEFISDPWGALPHYPLWDMNRGFGP